MNDISNIEVAVCEDFANNILFTLFNSHEKIGKEFQQTNKGIEKHTHATLQSATAEQIEIESIHELEQIFDECTANHFITSGINEHKTTLCVPASKIQETKSPFSVIARNNEHLKFPNRAGIMVIDSDGVDGFPSFEEIAGYDYLQTTSSSSNIYDENGMLVKGFSGCHTYLGVEDAKDIPRALEVFHKRQIIAGQEYHKLSQVGQFLERSNVDMAMKTPSQPVFIHAHSSNGLTQKKIYKNNHGKRRVDTQKVFPPLTPPEETEYQRKIAEARIRLEPQSKTTKKQYINKRAESTGESVVTIKQAIGNKTLEDDFVLYTALGKVTVREILADPKKWHNVNVCDPLEPNYGSVSTARIYCDQDIPIVRSHAHGGAQYRLFSSKKQLKNVQSVFESAGIVAPESGTLNGELLPAVEILPIPVASQQLATSVFLSMHYGEDGQFLICIKDQLFRFNGKFWETITKSELSAQIYQSAQLTQKVDDKNAITQTFINGVTTLVILQAVHNANTVEEPPPGHFVFTNGVFDFETGKLSPHTHKHLHRHAHEFDYNPNATSPVYDELLAELACSEPGWERLVLQGMGYCLAGGPNTAEKAIFLDGPTRSGKSSLAQPLTALTHPQNLMSGELKDIADQKKQLRMFDADLFYDDDCKPLTGPESLEINSIFKKMISGTTFEVNQLYTAEQKRGLLHIKMMLLSNGVPVLRDHSGATLARLIIIVFKKSFQEMEDKTLKNRIMCELQGIFNRFYQGYQDYKHNGFVLCQSSINALKDEREATQPMLELINKYCSFDPKLRVKASDINDHIGRWANLNPSFHKLNKGQIKKIVKQTLGSLNVEYKNSLRFPDGYNTSGYLGIGLKNI